MIELVCNNKEILPILTSIRRIMELIQIIVPILLLIFITISLTKLLSNPEDKKEIKKLINKALAAAIVFFIPVIINTVMNMLGENTNISSCWEQADYKINSNSSYIETNKNGKNNILLNEKEYEKGEKINKKTFLNKNKTNKVLFFGNSKTVGPNGGETVKDNNVAAKFEGIAKSLGYKVEVTTIDEGLPYQFSRLDEYYDCYVDQQCTACMSNGSGVASALSGRANRLKKKNPNIVIYLRQIWTFCSGGQINNDNGLQAAFKGAEDAAKKTNAVLIPDGKAFLLNKKSGINICDDDRHQNNKGAYLVGAITFKMLSGTTPKGSTYYGDIDSNTAKKLQEIAYNTK